MKSILYISNLLILLFSSNIFAVTISGSTCGASDRTASMYDADMCSYGSGNPGSSDIFNYYGSSWSDEGELTSNGKDEYLSATSNEGWGEIPNSGTWSIDSSFWDTYDYAVISMHIGNGGGDPDHFAWLMEDGATSGTWTLDFIPGGIDRGAGLSNIRLWGANGVSVPAPGALALMGLGLIGLVATRRKTKV